MKTIRPGVFETNSSSVHCIVLTTEDKFKAFENGEYMFDNWHDALVPIIEIFNLMIGDEDYVDWCKENDKKPVDLEKFKKVVGMLDNWDDDSADEEGDFIKSWMDNHEYRTYENYAGEYYETFEEHRTFGDQNIVAFGYYGHD